MGTLKDNLIIAAIFIAVFTVIIFLGNYKVRNDSGPQYIHERTITHQDANCTYYRQKINSTVLYSCECKEGIQCSVTSR